MTALKKQDAGLQSEQRFDELKALMPEGGGEVLDFPEPQSDPSVDPNETSAWVWGWVH